MANILITGSKGIVGTHLTDLLAERGHTVFGISDRHAFGSTGWAQEMAKVQHKYARCDVANYRQLERVFETAGPFDYVYHTAAEFGRWNGEDYYEQLWLTNAVGTKNVIRLQEKLGFKLVHFSSSEVYGDWEGVMSEDVMDKHEIKQMNDYAMSKWVNEMQIRNSAIKNSTQTVIVRLFNTYGPGEVYHPYRSVNCKFCYHALHGLPVTVYKGHLRSSAYILDTVATLANIVDNFKAGEAYNIGTPEEHDIETLAQLSWKHAGADPALISYSDAPEVLTTKRKQLDVSKAERDLNHKITTSLDDGIRLTVEWMRKYYGLQKA